MFETTSYDVSQNQFDPFTNNGFKFAFGAT